MIIRSIAKKRMVDKKLEECQGYHCHPNYNYERIQLKTKHIPCFLGYLLG